MADTHQIGGAALGVFCRVNYTALLGQPAASYATGVVDLKDGEPLGIALLALLPLLHTLEKSREVVGPKVVNPQILYDFFDQVLAFAESILLAPSINNASTLPI